MQDLDKPLPTRASNNQDDSRMYENAEKIPTTELPTNLRTKKNTAILTDDATVRVQVENIHVTREGPIVPIKITIDTKIAATSHLVEDQIGKMLL